MRQYNHIFFDLDGTLWDFGANSRKTLEDIYISENLLNKGIPSFDQFFGVYSEINHRLWALFRQGKTSKEELAWKRFYNSLKHFCIDDEALARRMSLTYITESPRKTLLMEGAVDILNYLYGKYHLHILTNGFTEVQYPKIENSGLKHFFDQVITSAEAGHLKPSPSIFEYAMKKTGALPENSLMIGDDPEVDCSGAQLAGWDSILLNTNNNGHLFPDHKQINELLELKEIL